MKPYKNTLELCKGIDPERLKKYLEDRTWKQTTVKMNYVSLFEIKKQEEGKTFQIMLPDSPGLLDYPIRVYEAIKKIAEYEEREFDSVLQDVRLPLADILRVAVVSEETKDGTILIDAGIDLLTNAKRAIIAAAYSVEKPQGFHPRAYNEHIEKLINSCRLGQSELGSYVATLFCPIEGAVQSTLDGKRIEEFGRKTTINLMNSLSHLNKSITEGKIDRVLNPVGEDPVVSANLCDAISGIQPEATNYSVKFKMTWAKGREPENIPSEVKFFTSDILQIEKIAEKLKPPRIDKDEEFVGKVAVLKGGLHDKEVQGEAIVSIVTDDGPVKAKLNLNHVDYKLATRMHVENKNILIKGRLVKESPRTYRIVKYSVFRELSTSS